MRRVGKFSNDCGRNQQISTAGSPVTYTTTDADNAPTARYKRITSSEKPPSIIAETVAACVNEWLPNQRAYYPFESR
jgi:hypothetical protein